MGGTPHCRRGHLAWLQAAASTTAAERKRCAAIVERWNEQPTHDWSPAIGTAFRSPGGEQCHHAPDQFLMQAGTADA
jgi:hypothetical protein